MRDTVEMAREATKEAPREDWNSTAWVFGDETLKAFEALVRADEREKYKWDIHSCGPTCKRYACVAMREAIEAERKACAKVCDRMAQRTQDIRSAALESAAENIRARSNT